MNVAHVDCTTELQRPLCEYFSIKDYPSLILLQGENAYKFKGQRTLSNLQDFVVKGWKNASSEQVMTIPARLEGMEKAMKDDG